MIRNQLRPTAGAGLALLMLAGLAPPCFAQDASAPPAAHDKTSGEAQTQPAVPPIGTPQNGVVTPPDVDPKMAKAAPDVDPKMAKPPAQMTQSPAKPEEQPPAQVQPR